MNPYELLGVPPNATPDEIEDAYHRRLRECHPDLHWADGDEAIDRAEQQTRALTEAMAKIRAGWAAGPARSRGTGPSEPWSGDAGPDWPPRGQHESWSNFGYRPDAEHDWFGNPTDRRVRADHVDCPLCGERYEDPEAYRYHLTAVHQVGNSDGTSFIESTSGRLEGRGSWLGLVPWPAFWFAVVLVLYWAAIVRFVPTLTARVVLVWVGALAYLFMIRLAFKHRHHR